MPQPEKLVWRSQLGWPPHSPADHADPKRGLVVHYDGSNQNLASKPHTACVTYWHNTRAFHTGPSRGWADVAYSFFACPHGYVLEGRGLYRYQAAQGTTAGNRDYYSVTLGCGPSDTITDAQINAVRQLREWLMEPATSISGTVKGHRDFVSTSCPGDKLYRMVRDGVFSKPARWGTTEEEDEVPGYLSMAQTKHVTIEPGKYVSLRWDAVWTDDHKVAHKDGLAFFSKRGQWSGAVWLELESLKPGDEVQVRVAEYIKKTKEYKLHPITEVVGTGGKTHSAVPMAGYIGEGRTADLRIYNVHDYPIIVRRATVKAHVWLR